MKNFYDENIKILFIGVDLRFFTYIHFAEQKTSTAEHRFRGFKFKVQHPVLGYWRLLKKLHRVS